MLRLINLFLLTILFQSTAIIAQEIAGHWQSSDGDKIILTEDGIAKIDNTNGTHYGKWSTDSGQIMLNLFSEYEPYTFSITDFFADLTYIGKGHIPESELSIYRNGYQLDPLPAGESHEETGLVSMDVQWLVTPRPKKGTHVAVWKMDDGSRLDLSEWGAFSVKSVNNVTSYGLFEIEDDILRLQFLFQDATYEYDLSSLASKVRVGRSTLTSTEFQQAEQQMFHQLLSQVQSTNQMMTQMSSQMLEQMHQTTEKMIINLSGNDWKYENEDRY